MNNSGRSGIVTLSVILLEVIVLFLFLLIGMKSNKENGIEPYTISSPEEFIEFINIVNEGHRFTGEYVLLINDIDFEGYEIPLMGDLDSGYYFAGTFNGDGHILCNINRKVDSGDNSLFGPLAGTVMNLGLESCEMQGGDCGSIASCSVNEKARIINCYSKASLFGINTGGISTVFDDMIVNCLTICDLEASEIRGNIKCYGGGTTDNCFAIYYDDNLDSSGVSGYAKFYIDGEKYTDFAQFTPIICDELNKGIHILAIECTDISIYDYNLWEVSEDGQSIDFSTEKATPNISDCIRYNIIKYYPFTAIGIGLIVSINILLFLCKEDKIYLKN